jgi:hypothetical protein
MMRELPATVTRGPPLDSGADAARSDPGDSAVDAEVAMSVIVIAPDGAGATGEVVESRLQASASDSAAIAAHPARYRGNILGFSRDEKGDRRGASHGSAVVG